MAFYTAQAFMPGTKNQNQNQLGPFRGHIKAAPKGANQIMIGIFNPGINAWATSKIPAPQ